MYLWDNGAGPPTACVRSEVTASDCPSISQLKSTTEFKGFANRSQSYSEATRKQNCVRSVKALRKSKRDMATFNGWTIITLPSDPPAPASIDFTLQDLVATVDNPFTGQQQIPGLTGIVHRMVRRDAPVDLQLCHRLQFQRWHSA